MRRLALLSLTAAVVFVIAASSVIALPLTEAGADLQATAPPTNTPRATVPPTNTPRPTVAVATPTPTPYVIGPDDFPDEINPLTGLPYPSAEAQHRRTLIIKVSNFPEVVRPQSGLSNADIVFEYEVEGAVTRFAAIFRSQGADHVGSVRSARLLDLELVPMFGALLAYSGANHWIDEYILNADWHWRALSPQHGVNDPCERFPRDDLAYEHTMFCDTFKLWDVAEERQVNDGQKVRGLAFSSLPDEGGEAAKDIYIDYWNERQDTRWQYNPADGRYYRWNSGLPHLDAATGQQLSTDNVVILEAVHVDRPDILDSEISGVVIETELWGSGTAWLFRDGLWYKGVWMHNQGQLGLWLTFPGGTEPMHLKPGQTWFEVVRPVMYGVEIAAEPVNAQATEQGIYAAQTQSAGATATYMAPYITPSPTPPTPTPVDLP
ncbi:DUF3048 domain-containing protein [Aggregatilinea lenta]|uniref:DUF3048 domain-containing protein n=1 Tax=Aggregatilinea lenta TaxID=913108 RepID=UPI000E5AC6C6|nr:DUF3048 domain-containing protein [Aggregatilinea lenta]